MKKALYDIFICIAAGVIVGFAFHVFANHNNFAPGGVNGLAAIIGYLCNLNMGYFTALLNLPAFVLIFIFINKRTAVLLTLYVIVQSATLILLDTLGFPYYQTESNLIFACIATGIISGYGYMLMIRRFGASAGTYAISSVVKHFRPEQNLIWLAFVMDVSVVAISFFVYGMKIEPVICTLVNLFIANYVVDYILRGFRAGYKVEIITDVPDELAAEIIREFRHSVTEIQVKGKYTDTDKYELICIIRPRQLAGMTKILKKYPGTFSYVSKVNEVFGRFKP